MNLFDSKPQPNLTADAPGTGSWAFTALSSTSLCRRFLPTPCRSVPSLAVGSSPKHPINLVQSPNALLLHPITGPVPLGSNCPLSYETLPLTDLDGLSPGPWG